MQRLSDSNLFGAGLVIADAVTVVAVRATDVTAAASVAVTQSTQEPALFVNATRLRHRAHAQATTRLSTNATCQPHVVA